MYKTNTNEQISRVQSFLIKPTFTTNHKQEVHEVKINTNLYIFSDYGGVRSLFCLRIAVRYRLSWAWRTCAPSYCLSYFLFKIYMKNSTHNTQHTTHNTQHTTHNTQHTPLIEHRGPSPGKMTPKLFGPKLITSNSSRFQQKIPFGSQVFIANLYQEYTETVHFQPFWPTFLF